MSVHNLKHRVSIFVLTCLYGLCCQAVAGSYDDFFKAVRQNDVKAVQALLARGFDPDTVNAAGMTGLMQAIAASSKQVSQVLAHAPTAHIDLRNAAGESALMLAALKGDLELCQWLIKKGADVNKTGWTPLHYAATNGHIDVINLLLDAYAYIDAESPNGTTPLMMAAQYGTTSAVKLLLEMGADPTLQNHQKLSAQEFARQGHHAESADIIAAFARGFKR